ncbi:hypothetical protein [Terriglobus sp. RCC_193]|uniref:hypothetical protein n=1 Tax=Terriglobus sp. RCC_193 TaxID=3239218 RepID=UPI003525CE75
MKRIILIPVLLSVAFCVGCNNNQAKLDALKAQYGPAYKQYSNDCLAINGSGATAMMGGAPSKPPTPEAEAAHNKKCAEESKNVTALEQQISALQQK